MELDDEVCLCFHVTKRKVESFIRVENPRRPSQLSECYGAGTGCGWCRPILKKMLECSLKSESAENSATGLKAPVELASTSEDSLTSDQYAELRQQYIADGHGVPPSSSP